MAMYGPNDVLGASGGNTGGCFGVLLLLIVIGVGLSAGLYCIC